MVALLLGVGADVARAQTAESATRTRLTTLLVAAPGTPDGKGLVPTALTEGHVALTQALLAARAGEDLTTLQARASDVIHALDPTRVSAAPGSCRSTCTRCRPVSSA
jgi:hypothetical protein